MANEIRVTSHGADLLPIDSLIEFQGDLKTISKENLEKLRRSILKHGFSAPIFVWKGVDNHILDGHQRLKALLSLRQEGYEIPLLPVVYVDADSEAHAKEKLLYITSQYGEFSTEGFADFIDGFNFDFSDIRLTDGEFSFQVADANETVGDDETPELKDDSISELGEIYELGPHRLMCGDSTDAEQVALLMGRELADMVFTDPPYNIGYQGVRDKRDKIKNDEMSSEDFIRFLSSSLMGCETMYVCCSWQYIQLFKKAMENISRKPKAMIVWDKVNPAQHLDKYFKQHELILYYGDFGGQKTVRGDVWRLKRQSNELHPTMKPVELIEMALMDQEDKKVVYDGFGGSGSTLIACGKTNRQCRMMEIDPKYCDVIRRRWTKWAKENGREVGSGALEDKEV